MKSMKNVFAIIALVVATTVSSFAQSKSMTNFKTVRLEQTKGEFTQKQITVSPGEYVFEISNNNAGTDVGFVLVPQGKDISKPENHIKTAYVTNVVKEGTVEKTKSTTLTPGTYIYFCPLNKTSTDNVLIVK
ncbi:hypothetical protein ULMA_05870 [Patiriisocius marinus]|uniref:Uncharacterized protein n=2 Tax=Patiriisocius marinus TaxID=1397112 RepID=A0A5J4IML4_9FLAO|nr:cupredoxin domain-containing protein [Patiriisocius marinus]GER58479.1 hypothetical protein ULMA_05870 [Patiriisocius marinus]